MVKEIQRELELKLLEATEDYSSYITMETSDKFTDKNLIYSSGYAKGKLDGLTAAIEIVGKF